MVDLKIIRRTVQRSGFLLFLLYSVTRAGQDTVFIRLKSPAPLTVIRGNAVRIVPELPDGISGRISEIRYFAAYKGAVDTLPELRQGIARKFLGAATRPPFDLVADLTAIPDQDGVPDLFSAEAIDKNGRAVPARIVDQGFLFIDRNPRLNDMRFPCRYLPHPPALDGKGTGWQGSDSAVFTNNANRVTLWSAWDETALYLAVRVQDDNLVAPYTDKGFLTQNRDLRFAPGDTSAQVPLWLYDEVELFFDPRRVRGEVRTMDHAHLLIGAGGAWYGRRFDYAARTSEFFGTAMRCHVAATASPPGYRIELALTWAELGVRPRSGLAMGFDCFNKDKMEADGAATSRSLSGNDYTNYNNPSEWGSLKLGPKPFPWALMDHAKPLVAGLLLVAALGIGAAYRRRKRAHMNHPDDLTEESVRTREIAGRIESYIHEHLTDPRLSALDIAKAAGVSPKYAGNIFKKVYSQSFIKYINLKRIAEARNLLVTSELNVTEIAYKLGFNSPEQFIRVFKAEEGLPPLEFRQKRR